MELKLCLQLEEFLCGITGLVIDCVIDFNTHGTGRGAVYRCPNLLELMDGSTSSHIATDYQ